uniref:Plastid-targeted DNA polymerase n=1 Tax=Bigelowiella natans TaxID=227086 RepID=A0A510EYA4_BIGNA|nr:plastid-targeted DNA polymerase [Bigelowiella natans]
MRRPTKSALYRRATRRWAGILALIYCGCGLSAVTRGLRAKETWKRFGITTTTAAQWPRYGLGKWRIRNNRGGQTFDRRVYGAFSASSTKFGRPPPDAGNRTGVLLSPRRQPMAGVSGSQRFPSRRRENVPALTNEATRKPGSFRFNRYPTDASSSSPTSSSSNASPPQSPANQHTSNSRSNNAVGSSGDGHVGRIPPNGPPTEFRFKSYPTPAQSSRQQLPGPATEVAASFGAVAASSTSQLPPAPPPPPRDQQQQLSLDAKTPIRERENDDVVSQSVSVGSFASENSHGDMEAKSAPLSSRAAEAAVAPSSHSSSSSSSTSTTTTTTSASASLAAARAAPEGVTVVSNLKQLRHALKVLCENPDKIHACDTEVADIDLKKVGPVGNGKVICVSIYSGPDVDFGGGAGKALWVDTMGKNEVLLEEMKGWFEDPRYKKVWHNYGFDRHVLYNMGVDARGFFGDTMHMARLWDTSREKRLSAKLTTSMQKEQPHQQQQQHPVPSQNNEYGIGNAYHSNDEHFEAETPPSTEESTASGDASSPSSSSSSPPPSSFGKGYSLEALTMDLVGRRKIPMIEIFGIPKLKKDGTPGKILELPAVEELQSNPNTSAQWIEYSAYDAEGTWLLHRELTTKLLAMPWEKGLTMYDFYTSYLVPFGELLTDMERNGIYVDTSFLKEAEKTARAEIQNAEETFHKWAVRMVGDVGWLLNPQSGPQIQTLLFGGSFNRKSNSYLPEWREFKIPNPALSGSGNNKNNVEGSSSSSSSTSPLIPEELVLRATAEEARKCLRTFGLKLQGNKEAVQQRLLRALTGSLMQDDLKKKSKSERDNESVGEEEALLMTKYTLDPEIEATLSQRDTTAKFIKINVTGLGVPTTQTTAKGLPAVDANALKELSGDPEEEWKNGRLYDFFGGGEEGVEACKAIGALRNVGTVGAMITNFLVPLQTLADNEQRVHCSLNLNTETGRLSSRRPNLQNQPALEKDQYKIREAFRAEEGNTLIVADYGQLELRILAHITGCESMIEAFASGVDFHSATAVDMFPHVKAAVDSGEVLLEWHGDGKPTKPLVKEKFGSERRKAKTLNFSIVYGKTVQGLSKDWGVTIEEAQELLDKWFAARPEVQEWQQNTINNAKRTGFCRTLMGRYRALPEMRHRSKWVRAHGERAAINSPVQGGAADIVMMAMVKLHKSPVLRYLNYRLLLQVHDEVIIEGPEEHAEAALQEVISCMTAPFDGVGLRPLKVDLDVDAKYAKSWYQAK